jgi:signal transduction histidine kinase
MARRAATIGGEVKLSSSGEGTTVEPRLPMTRVLAGHRGQHIGDAVD